MNAPTLPPKIFAIMDDHDETEGTWTEFEYGCHDGAYFRDDLLHRVCADRDGKNAAIDNLQDMIAGRDTEIARLQDQLIKARSDLTAKRTLSD